MTISSEISPVAEPSAAAIANLQHGLACWTRAWTQLAHGMMSASLAQMELARSMCAAMPSDWGRTPLLGALPEAPRRFLDVARDRAASLTRSYRHISDEFAATCFAAAETLVEGLGTPAEQAEVLTPPPLGMPHATSNGRAEERTSQAA